LAQKIFQGYMALFFHRFYKRITMSKNKKPRHAQKGQQGEGRQNNSLDKVAEERGSDKDISRVDQQEGAMKHGELGGNFKDEEDPNNTRGDR
jgi:hypothetical protein